MRVMQSDLAILNATQYEDGYGFQQGRAGKVTMKTPPSDRNGVDTKKRPRTTTIDEPTQGDPEDERKRARGRPRLDPTDQTPQDRRRTQIRLAQRAYRNRKESAITTLEKEVDGLKQANQQISLAYRDLLQHAMQKGLLEEDPEFGQRLMAIDALTKASAERTGKEDEADSSDSAAGSSGPRSIASKSPTSSLNPATLQQRQQQPQQLWGGIIVSHEAPTLPPQHLNHAVPNMPIPTGASNSVYEVLAQPNSHNASFPQSMPYNQPSVFSQSAWNTAHSPWNPLSSPNTYAWNELSFGRRLHRSAIQCAAMLITMSNPPPDKMMRVFGFSRLFETYEQIRERTLASAGLSINDDLSHWKYPIHSFGGAGTHFPEMPSQMPSLRTSSKGSPPGQVSPKPRLARPVNPFPHGPVDQRTGKLRESLIKLGGRIDIPGFDGIFWDPDEVEFYLLSNGVNIPPLCDHWVVELEDGTFAGPPAGNPSQAQTQSQGRAPSTSTSSNASARVLSTPSTAGTASTVATSTDLSTPETNSGSSIPAQIWQSQPTPTGAEPWARPFKQAAIAEEMAHMNATTTAQYQDPSLLGFGTDGQHPPSHLPIGAEFQGLSNLAEPSVPRKNVWKIDVEKFTSELVNRGHCLGRTPGFKPEDVDEAFWASVVSVDGF
ncbi:hypothetical protein BKA67DRAFT_662481 [Truncatella angustata]|uniref:BZIP domain-containing protein n=1 Tax=Truncatella angustata TaxID=152316 RepID=A0A9P8RP04_9PEZI|nr:uncharacterized protein BKA67DRAFT_662481 [Truncatella angustata]KAH6647715.1 hypothetical protein BKA67DRAFT_662481 [Truncatella angustata]